MNLNIDLDFKTAAEKIKTLNIHPKDEELLELYGFYKQATQGDINITRPGFWDLKGKAKWDSWNLKKGLTTSEAEDQYVKYVIFMLGKYAKH